jgi:hypothetical protein
MNFRLHRRLMRMFERITALPYSALFLTWIGLAFIFGGAYMALSYIPGHGPTGLEGTSFGSRLFDCLYYSIITATSTGYGDITPMGFSKFLAALQSILALMIFALFVTKLVTLRQEITLRQVHKMTYEDVYYKIREGFYIIRKDFDQIIALVNKHKKLTEENWADLRVAFQQGGSLLSDIPDFYDEQHQIYTIDIQREKLLQEGVHRTLERVEDLLDDLVKHNINIREHENCIKELSRLLGTARDVVFYWQERSPYDDAKMFEAILSVNAALQEKLEGLSSSA